MTLDVYSGVLDGDLDAVADRLDAAPQITRGLPADCWRTDGHVAQGTKKP